MVLQRSKFIELYFEKNDPWMTKNVNLWLLYHKGDRADSNGMKVSHRVFIDFDSRHNTDLVIEVCLCNSDNPPPRKDKTVKPMCRFRCPMRALECGDWQRLVDDEGMVTRIGLKNVMLSMIFDGELRCMLRTGDDHAEFELEMEPVVESEMEDGFEGRCRIGFL